MSQGFTDEGVSSGINLIHDGPDRNDNNYGTGAAWIDYNQDGNLDLYVTMSQEANKLFKNIGDGFFIEVGQSLGAGDSSHSGAGVAIADFNNDGWPDIFLANEDQDVLLKNNQGINFSDITLASGIAIDSARGTSASWGDYNDDGFLDLYISNHTFFNSPNPPDTSDKLYKNNGNGTFTDVSEIISLAGNIDGLAYNAVWTDFDRDGDLDILLINDCLAINPVSTRIFRNEGDTHPFLSWNFTEVSEAVGLDDCSSAMGIAIGDYDRDGWMDFFYTDIGTPHLYHNNNGTLNNVTGTAGISVPAPDYYSWGANFFDYDLDGWVDLFVAFGSLKHDSDTEPRSNQLYRNDGNGNSFTNVSETMNMNDVKTGRTSVFGDYDNDGDLDMFIVNYAEEVLLLRNNNNNGNHFLKINLIGTISNRDGIGAYIKITTPDGMIQYMETKSGSSLGGGDATETVFGLGTNNFVNTIEIIWPSGIIQILDNINAGTEITIVEPEENPCTDVFISPPQGIDAEYCSGSEIPALMAITDSAHQVFWYSLPEAGILLAENSANFTPDGPGTYYAETRVPETGCISESRTPVTLIANPLPSVNGGLNEFACQGIPVTFNAIATGGDGNYSFEWTNGLSNTANLTVAPTTHTSYVVTVTDGNGCTDTDIVTAVVYELPYVNAGGNFVLNCHDTIHTINAENSVWGDQFLYQWTTFNGSFVDGTNTLTPLIDAAGTYTLLIINLENGCFNLDKITVTEADPLSLTTDQITQPTCFASNNGIISISATGGIPEYNYQWSNGANTSTVINLSSGIYTVTVIDENNCSTELSHELIAPPEILLKLAMTPESNQGNEDGSITTAISGGIPPYEYTWEDESENTFTTENLDNLAAGLYCLTITDQNDCIQTACIQVDMITASENPAKDEIITIAPNPASNHFTIAFGDAYQQETAIMELWNPNGRKIMAKEKRADEEALIVNIASLAEGIYLVKVIVNDKITVSKMVISD